MSKEFITLWERAEVGPMFIIKPSQAKTLIDNTLSFQ
jgi:hypothetical protein